jgi:hypothetical protein
MIGSEKPQAPGRSVSVPLYVAVMRALIRDRGDRLIDQAGHNELIRLLAGVQVFFDALPRPEKRRGGKRIR